MKLLDYNEYVPQKKKLNKRKAFIVLVIIILFILICTLTILYNLNSSVQSFMDNYIFRKNISSENLPTVEFNSDDVTAIYGYDKYIALLNKNSLTAYSSSGKKEFTIDLAVGTPIAKTAGSYLVVGEKNSQKLYLVNGSNILWQNEVEGEIVNLSVNKNGYVTVIVTSTTHKNIVITIDPNGKELFYTFFASSTAIAACISNDNKHLAIAEINTSENSLQSNIKIISMENAVNDSSNAVVYIYPASSGEVISHIQYQDKGTLVCMYDTSIHIIKDKTDTKIYDISSKKDLFVDIHLKDNFVYVAKENTSIFSDVVIGFTDVYTQKVIEYKASAVPKSIIANHNIIAVCYGSEIDFVNTSGWLVKRYRSNQEIKNIVIGTNIIGIIYKDKLEIFGI